MPLMSPELLDLLQRIQELEDYQSLSIQALGRVVNLMLDSARRRADERWLLLRI